MCRKTKRLFFFALLLLLTAAVPIGSAPSQSAATTQLSLIPCGNAIGVKVETDGVLVIGISEFETDRHKTEAPSADARIREGDIIRTVDGRTVHSMEELREAVQRSQGKTVTITLTRGEREMTVTVIPQKSKVDDSFYIGAWVRDSTAGIGTMTYYDPATDRFGALGHPICDMDTNDILQIGHGELLSASVSAVSRGEVGAPGELRGTFGAPIGQIESNGRNGIFGTVTNPEAVPDHKAVRVAADHEIKTGAAEILCNLNGTEVRSYQIEIRKISPLAKLLSHDMVLRITDRELLKQTGGIIQGMSGSPILQDGKLVGAVTHVLVNDPTMGYGIFISRMLDPE